MSVTYPPRPRRTGVRGFVALLAACTTLQCSRDSGEHAATAASTPQRIVPASATAVDLVAALVPPERVAGFPEQALEYSTLHAGDPRFDRAARFNAYLAEPVLALDPDLVVIDPWQAPETTARLREAGIRVLVVPEIHSWPQARAALEMLAGELDARAAGGALLADLDSRVAALRQHGAAGPKLRALCYSNYGAAGSTAGAETTLDEVMRLAGLSNAVADLGRVGHGGIDFELLLVLDPDVIVTSLPLKMEAGPAGDRGGASAQLLYGEPSLAQLRAVREKRIVSLPAWLFATGSHEIVHAAEELSAQVDALLARLERERATHEAQR
jgi:iron complex transport system substrate-binding protein